jgi:glucose/arabinose dehydrogenase
MKRQKSLLSPKTNFRQTNQNQNRDTGYHRQDRLDFAVESCEPRIMLSTIQIFAAGSIGGEQMQLQIDGTPVQTWNVPAGANTESFQEYTYVTPNRVTADNVQIHFLNDVYEPGNGIDTNLRVDAIQIDGVRFETEAPSVFSTGSWLPADGLQPGFRQSEYLNANGYFQFAGGNVNNTVTVRARGDEGSESFRLIVADQTVGTFTTTTDFQEFSANVGGNISASDIRVEFFGDIYAPEFGVDTNLVVDYVTLNGIFYQTESVSTLSTGTWLPADGVTTGFRKSETLHVNGYFDFAASGGSQTIDLVARGDEGTENLRLLSNGVLIDEFVVETEYQTYRIQTDAYAPGTNLRIEFNNDVYDPANGIDTNLHVVRVTIDGETREVDDPSTFSSGTWNSELGGFIDGFNESQVLFTSGYFLLDFSSGPVEIAFAEVGSFRGIVGGPEILANPTSLQFGPDGRLYVSEQNGMINAFTIQQQGNQYVATAVEQISLVKEIQNHNDDGSLSDLTDRQVTGIVVTGTAAAPVLYVSSSDPRISFNGEVNLDTNSGVITRLTRNGNSWNAVDIVRGLPRSEENHSNNGLVLSPDGTQLYVAVGGNTNNGAPSSFFSYTGEYALSGTVLEIDLTDINSRAVLTDNSPGQNGRQYIYNLPTLDDPTVANVNGGLGENAQGLDEAGPWGGNDGLNMAILPADAPLRIYADGFRNHFDLVITQQGNLYTVDNGSNANLGGDPIFVNGEATSLPNDGGDGDPEPLFLIEEGGYYGHPNPTRSNQDLSWTVRDNNGNPDTSLSVNSVNSLAALVPNAVNIQNGFLIDPSKFTGDPARLTLSGTRVQRDTPQSNTLLNVGSSSNGLVEYNSTAFGGQLNGDLLVAQFNGNIGRLDLNANGMAATYETIPGLSGLSIPLDVTTGPNGTVWVGELGDDFIKVFAPSGSTGISTDIDGDGLLNTVDPFTRDATNGGQAVLQAGSTFLWDFDANQDNNLVGPDGYGGGLTGVMVNGLTDFEQFFQSPSPNPGQNVNLDNVKFITAAGGGTTVVEVVSAGDAYQANNTGEFLFHTGITVAPSVDTFTIEWTVFNPGGDLAENFQQIGGYIGTGDQSNYLKLVAINHPQGEIELVLEDSDTTVSQSYVQANDLFQVPANSKIFLRLTIDVSSATATPQISYETANGIQTVSGSAISLAGTAVLDAIEGNHTVNGQTTGLAVGLFSSNFGPAPQPDFQAIFDGIQISAASNAGFAAAVVPTPLREMSGEELVTTHTPGATLTADGRLFVQGTERRDNVSIRTQGDQLRVQTRLNLGTADRSKATQLFDIRLVERIIINLDGGDDVAKIASNVLIDAELSGGTGDDRLTAGNGANTLRGGDGDDLLKGGDNIDVIIGGLGSDRLLGRGGSDVLSGQAGNDQLVGGNGDFSDVLIGGVGNDDLSGGAGDDLLVGHQFSHEVDQAALYMTLVVWQANQATIPIILGTLIADPLLDRLNGGSGSDLLLVEVEI